MNQQTRLGRTLVTLAALLVLGTTFSLAYNLLNPPRRWFPGDTPRLITVDDNGMASVTDSDNGVSRSVNAVKAWNGSGVNVVSATAGTVAYGLGDNRSDLIFGDPAHICNGQCLAATTTGFYDSDQAGSCGGLGVVRITDSDVAFNLRYNYTTAGEPDGCSGEIFLESVVTHEIGHVIGLGHSGNGAALMAPTVSSCDNKMLNSDDNAGRDELYNCSFSGGGDPPPGGCDLGQKGDSCTSGSECCSGNCKGKSGRKTCK